MAYVVHMKRIYDGFTPEDGQRVLVDRLWPRGVSKEDAHVDEWAKDATPSNELRKWYHEDPAERFDEFKRRYRLELEEPAQKECVHKLRAMLDGGSMTLLTAAKDIEHSHVPILKERLMHKADHA